MTSEGYINFEFLLLGRIRLGILLNLHSGALEGIS